MAKTHDKEFKFNKIGTNDHIPYSKAELTKMGRVGNNYSLSFYQLDYLAMAQPTAADNGEKKSFDDNALLIPVGKIVLDRVGFDQLCTEINQIKAAIDAEK